MVSDTIPVGNDGSVVLSFSGGMATLTASVGLDAKAIAVGAQVSVNAGTLIDQLEKIVAAALPVTAPIDPAIFAVIKSAVLAIQ